MGRLSVDGDTRATPPGPRRSLSGQWRARADLTPTAPSQSGGLGGVWRRIHSGRLSADIKTCVFSWEANGQVGESDNISVVPGLVRSGDGDERTLTPTAPWQRGAGGGLLPQIRFNHSSAGTKTCVFSVEADGQGGYADKTPTISQSR